MKTFNNIKKITALALSVSIVLAVYTVPAFAEARGNFVEGDTVLFMPPEGKMSALPLTISGESAAPVLTLDKEEYGVYQNAGSLILDGDTAAATAAIAVSGTANGVSASKNVTVSNERLFWDFEDGTVGGDITTAKADTLDGTQGTAYGAASTSKKPTLTGSAKIAENGGQKYLDTWNGDDTTSTGENTGAAYGVISFKDTDGNWLFDGSSVVTVEFDGLRLRHHKFMTIYTNKSITTSHDRRIQLATNSGGSYWWGKDTTESGNVGSATGSFNPNLGLNEWKRYVVTADLKNNTLKMYVDGSLAIDAALTDYGDDFITEIVFQKMYVDNLAVYSGAPYTVAAYSVTGSVPENIAASSGKTTVLPISARLEPLGMRLSYSSSSSDVSVENGSLLRINAGASGDVTLTASHTRLTTPKPFTISIASAIEEDFQDLGVGDTVFGGTVESDEGNKYLSGDFYLAKAFDGSAILKVKIKGSGQLKLNCASGDIGYTAAFTDTLWHDLVILTDSKNESCMMLIDNNTVSGAVFKGAVTGLTATGISADDIFLGNTYDDLPVAINTKMKKGADEVGGKAYVGDTLTASAEYLSFAGVKQSGTASYKWYISDSLNTLGTVISSNSSLLIDRAYIGRYLTLGATVTDEQGRVSAESYSVRIAVEDLFSAEEVSGGIRFTVQNGADYTELYPVVVTYSGDAITGIYTKDASNSGQVITTVEITSNYSGAVAFLLDGNLEPLGDRRIIGNVPTNVYTAASGTARLEENNGRLTFVGPANSAAALFVLKTNTAGSFNSSKLYNLSNVKAVITPTGVDLFGNGYLAYADIVEGGVSFKHGITAAGIYKAAVGGRTESLNFAVSPEKVFEGTEINELSAFCSILGEITGKTYTVYPIDPRFTLYSTFNAYEKANVGRFIMTHESGEVRADVSRIDAAIYMQAFLKAPVENKESLKEELAALGLATDPIDLIIKNASIENTLDALPTPCSLEDYLAAMKVKAITLGIKNAANYLEAKVYLSAVGGSIVTDAMALELMGNEYDDLTAVRNAINNYGGGGGGNGNGNGNGNGSGNKNIDVIGGVSKNNDTSVSGTTSQGNSRSKFSDVPSSHWAFKEIGILVDAGIVNGYEDGTFLPEGYVSRAELVKLICLAFKLSGHSDEFKDVGARDWYYPYVGAAAECGIVNGSDGCFKPDDIVSREDAAVMLYRAAENASLELKEGDVTVTDIDEVSGYARKAVSVLNGCGVIKGTEDGSYAPKASLTRAQAAAVLVRMLAE